MVKEEFKKIEDQGKDIEKEFEEKVISIDRITRVVKGGRRLRFRAIVVVGDGKGKVGVGVEKSTEVVGAIEKAVRKAKKNLKNIKISETTIPHEVTARYAGAQVFLKPAKKGTGVIAGGAVRSMLEVVGIKDILSKIQGSNSKLNNVYATLKALEMLIFVESSNKNEKNPTMPKAMQGKGVKDGSIKSKKASK